MKAMEPGKIPSYGEVELLRSQLAELESTLARCSHSELLYLSALHHASITPDRRSSLDELLLTIIAHAATLMNTVHGYIQLQDQDHGAMRVKVGIGMFQDQLGDPTPRGRGITWKVWESGEPFIVDDYDSCPQRGQSLKRGICRTLCAVPLKVGSDVIGVMALAHTYQDDKVFRETEVKLLTGFAEIAALALENAQLQSAVEESSRESILKGQALAESESNYQWLFEINPNFNILIDEDQLIIDVNHSALNSLGYEKHEIVRRSLTDFVAPNQRQMVGSLIGNALAGKQIPLVEIEVQGKSQKRTLLVASGQTGVRIRDGKRSIMVSAIDATDRKWAEEELATTYALMMEAIKQTPAGVLVAEAPDGKIRIANAVALQIRGETKMSLTNIPISLHPERWQICLPDRTLCPAEELPLSRALLKGETSRDLEAIVLRDNGEERWVRINAAPVYSQRGEIVAGVAVIADITDRKRSGLMIKETEGRYRALFEDSRDAIFISSKDGKLLNFNQSALDLFGYTRSELQNLNIEKLYAQPENRSRYRAEIERNGFVRDYPIQVQRRDGAILECLETATVRKSKDGEIIGYQGIIRDITEKKRSEAALQESEEKFRTFTEQALLGIIIFRDDSIVFLNDALANILGHPKSEIYQWRSEEAMRLVHPEDHELVFTQLKKKLASDPSALTQYEFRIISASGSVRWVTLHSKPITLGGETAIEATMLDITDRKAAEQELRFRNAFDEVITGISTRFINLAPEDVDLGINYALGEIGDFVGVERSYVILLSRENTIRATHEWTAEGVEPQFAKLQLSSTEDFPWLFKRILRKEIIYVPRISSLSPKARAELLKFLPTGTQSAIVIPMIFAGNALGALGFDSINLRMEWSEDIIALLKIIGEIFVNALERKRVSEALKISEQQFRQAQKMEAIGQLAGGVAHDFNNLLTVISGQVELMMMALKTYDPLHKNLEEIHKASDRAATLIKQLLAFSRKQALEPRIMDLNELITDMKKMLQRLIGEDIELISDPLPDSWTVKVDPGQFQQVITNLVVNARDAMPEGGEIRINIENVVVDESFLRRYRYFRPGEYVMTQLSDTGEGMSDEIQAHIFEPFFTTKEQGKGTGLGLSMVYGIVKQSDGYITVTSEPGKGAAFGIYLPRVVGEAEKMIIRPVPGDFVGGGETILVVEDEEAVREMAVGVLKTMGYQVYAAVAGEEALELCRKLERPVDLVLTDVVMPRMSGTELAVQLRSLWGNVKIVFMSGYTSEAAIQKVLIDSNAPYIQKPFRLGALAHRVREVLDS